MQLLNELKTRNAKHAPSRCAWAPAKVRQACLKCFNPLGHDHWKPHPTTSHHRRRILIRDVSADDIFTPEEWTEEHRMMLQTGPDFVAQRIIPNPSASKP